MREKERGKRRRDVLRKGYNLKKKVRKLVQRKSYKMRKRERMKKTKIS
jgi:hypothetical protein